MAEERKTAIVQLPEIPNLVTGTHEPYTQLPEVDGKPIDPFEIMKEQTIMQRLETLRNGGAMTMEQSPENTEAKRRFDEEKRTGADDTQPLQPRDPPVVRKTRWDDADEDDDQPFHPIERRDLRGDLPAADQDKHHETQADLDGGNG